MTFENRYSTLDRVLHRLAFATGSAQIGLADIEEQLFKKQLTGIEVDKPVFITGLPRAGTTLLLEIIVSLDEFVSYSYRDMPFVLTPMFWSRFSASFRQSDVPRERAHGDGMLVSVDSPEAFEEIVWKAFWGKHYEADSILPWGEDDNAEFSEFFSKHIRKIVALHRKNPANSARYVSKNNQNIARLGLLRRCFPEAVIIVPFRQPLQHASSLLRQHLNFLDIHSRDHFARDYMAGIGHFDFGENLRPVNFDGWLTDASCKDATRLEFWLEYWTATYRHILENAGGHASLLSYEALCEHPERELGLLAEVMQIDRRAAFIAQSSKLRVIKPISISLDSVNRELINRAEAVYQKLSESSLC